MVGQSDILDYTTAETKAMFVLFLFLVVIIMLNLLIAIMSDTYERVTENNDAEARKLRAQIIIDEEKLLAPAELLHPPHFPAFLQLLQAKELTDAPWAGLGGKMACEVAAVRQHVGEVEAKVSDGLAAVGDSIARVESTLEARVEGLDGKIDELKLLLTQLVGAKHD